MSMEVVRHEAKLYSISNRRLTVNSMLQGVRRDKVVRVKTSTKQFILHLNVPTVCTDAKGQLYCHATGIQAGGSRKDQCRFMKRKFAGFALRSVTKLKVLVTEPARWNGSLGSRAADALETRLGRLYRGCGASTVAAISVFPNLTSLDIDVRLKGHVADRFWEAMVLAQGLNM